MLSPVFSKITTYLNEVLFELKKITWPKREELFGATIIVCMLVVVFAVILGGMDTAFGYLIRKFIIG